MQDSGNWGTNFDDDWGGGSGGGWRPKKPSFGNDGFGGGGISINPTSLDAFKDGAGFNFDFIPVIGKPLADSFNYLWTWEGLLSGDRVREDHVVDWAIKTGAIAATAGAGEAIGAVTGSEALELPQWMKDIGAAFGFVKNPESVLTEMGLPVSNEVTNVFNDVFGNPPPGAPDAPDASDGGGSTAPQISDPWATPKGAVAVTYNEAKKAGVSLSLAALAVGAVYLYSRRKK